MRLRYRVMYTRYWLGRSVQRGWPFRDCVYLALKSAFGVREAHPLTRPVRFIRWVLRIA